MNNNLVIDVQGLNKYFGDKHVVKNFSLQVRRGEIYGFLGPNGSGKTTSIRMLCGLLTPDSGSGTCLGHDIRRETAAIKREVGYMTQRFSLWDDLSIRENLEFVARMYGMKDRRQAVTREIDQLGLTDRQHQLAGSDYNNFITCFSLFFPARFSVYLFWHNADSANKYQRLAAVTVLEISKALRAVTRAT